MKYLIFPNKSAAEQANADLAVALGSGGPSDTTKYWYGVRQHPTLPLAALEISDDGTALTQDQREALVDGLSADWTPPNALTA